MNQKGFVKDIIIVILALVVAGAVYIGWTKGLINFESKDDLSVSEQQVQNESNKTTSDWKTYTNGNYGFQFKYPAGYTIKRTETDDVVMVEFPSEGTYMQVQYRNNALLSPGNYEPFGAKYVGSTIVDGVTANRYHTNSPIRVDIPTHLLKPFHLFPYTELNIPVDATHYISISYHAEISDYEEIANQIISTFKFIK